MNNLIAIIFATLTIVLMVNGEGKLQIGIKKRVENCTTKTRKGDLVHIHYTVSTAFYGRQRFQCSSFLSIETIQLISA